MAKRKIDKDLLKKGRNTFNKQKQQKQKAIEEAKLKAQQEKEKQEKKLQEEKRLEEERRQQELENKIEKYILKTYRLKLTTLSPIHIGDGEMYEPISYVIDKGFLYYFDENFVLFKLLEMNGINIDINRLNEIGILVETFKKYKSKIIENEFYKNKISVSKDIESLYNKEYGSSNNDDNSFNQMLIQKHISTYNPKNYKYEPYISGSSIKGAIQTVLNLSDEDSKYFKVSDTLSKNINFQIAWSVRKVKKGIIPQKLEVISKGSVFECNISFSNIIDLKTIKDKLSIFYQQADNKQYFNFSREIKKDNQFLLRLGRYVGQRFMGNLSETPKTKSMFRLSEKNEKSELPFGWVLCEIIS